MIEQLKKEIEVIKNNLAALPKNNKTNIKKYNDYLTEIYNQYNGLFTKIDEEIKDRFYSFFPSSNYGRLRNLKLELDAYNIHILFNTYKTTYEKLGIDRLLYDINHFYKNDLEKVNNDILQCINKYKETGLTDLEFNYSSYCNEYVQTLINNKDNEKLIRETFDKIYWKCPEIVTHIELNLKSIYLNNKKKLGREIEEQDHKYFSKKSRDVLLEEYFNKVREYDSYLENDKLTIQEKFRTGELKVKDYKEDSVKKAYSIIKDADTEIDDYLNSNIKKLSYSLEEYKNYIEYSYIITDIRNKYQNKEKYKGVYDNLLQEIEKEESKLFKINKKISKINKRAFISEKKKEEKIAKLNIEVNSLISSLKDKYEKLEESTINDWVLKRLEDESTYKDILHLASTNYNYMIKLLTKENENITLEEVQKVILDLKDFIYSPYNTIINNITITEEKNIPSIISDGYKLLNINITADNLYDNSSIDNMLDNIKIINYANILKKQQMDINDIDYIIQIDEMNKKMAKKS